MKGTRRNVSQFSWTLKRAGTCKLLHGNDCIYCILTQKCCVHFSMNLPKTVQSLNSNTRVIITEDKLCFTVIRFLTVQAH